MMKISVKQSRILSNVLSDLGRENHISIYTIEESYGNEAPLKYGVNWCAMGTQSAEKALEYAEALQHAAKVAEALNSLELVIDWTDDPAYIEHMKETMRDVFRPSFTEIVNRGERQAIEYALKAFDECYCTREV